MPELKDCCIVVELSEPFGVQLAAKNLAEDIEEACGTRPPVVEKLPAKAAFALLVESAGKRAKQFHMQNRIIAPESFAIKSVKVNGTAAILIAGADERGAIYGVYHFSEWKLGTDPCKFWTGCTPPRREKIPIGELDFTSPPQRFRFRGFHVERSSDLEGWRSEDGKAGWHIYWEKIFETLLRLKGNMVKAERNEPASPKVALAQKMGVLITQEHGGPLGVYNGEIAPDDPNFKNSFRETPQVYLDAWEKGILSYPDRAKVIWTLGFRGRGDRPFWFDDRSMADATDAERGALISDVLRAQKELVLKHCAQFHPVFIHNQWMEGVRLYREGHVRPPEGTYIVWADNGYGTFRSMLAAGCEPEQVCSSVPDQPCAGQHGFYYHVSMYDMNAPDLAQFVPPERIRREFAKMIRQGATAYALINVGKIREQVLGVAAVMDAAANPDHWADPATDAAEEFWRKWCARYFGDLADEARECYRMLYDTPFKWGEWGGWDDYVIGEIGYYRRARMLVMEALNAAARRRWESERFKFWNHKALPLKEQAAHFRGQTSSVIAVWEKAREKSLSVHARLTGAAKDFFEENVLAQIEMHMHSNLYLHHMIAAVMSYEEGRYAESEQSLTPVAAAMDGIRAAMARMEHGKWAGWNRANYWAGIAIAEDTLEIMKQVVKEFLKQRRG